MILRLYKAIYITLQVRFDIRLIVVNPLAFRVHI